MLSPPGRFSRCTGPPAVFRRRQSPNGATVGYRAGECVPARPDIRDPFVFPWGDKWRMVLAQPTPWDRPFDRRSRLLLLRSLDLEIWEEIGPLGPTGEPGELFETPFLRRVPVTGKPPEGWPWLLAMGVVDRAGGAVCSSRAWFGRFDGLKFQPVGAPSRLTTARISTLRRSGTAPLETR